MGTDDTTLIDMVEPSSFVAVGDRLPVHLKSSYSTACPGDTRTNTKKNLTNSCEEARTSGERHNVPDEGN